MIKFGWVILGLPVGWEDKAYHRQPVRFSCVFVPYEVAAILSHQPGKLSEESS